MYYPAYPWTDSYPYHMTNPRPKEIDRGTMNLPYYPWPNASHHCYPTPQGCHSCCNHSYFGGPYSFTSPYYHHPPPFHPHGFYPPFPGAHPVPPPNYSMEQPRYDYDKNTRTPTTHHCPGCEKKSNTGQEEPEVEKKTKECPDPFLKDYPYPIMWVPPSYTNTESKNANEKENHFHNPVLKPIEASKLGGNGETPQESFPFPIFWLPSKNNKVGNKDMKEDNHNLEAESEKSSKHGVQKVIPVKQLGAKEENKTDNGKEEKKVSQKISKLPPVCLRIDPLPRKKNSSRSPSPPGDKERSKVSTMEDSKSFKQQTQSSEDLKNDSKKVEKDSVVDSCSEKGVEVEGSKVEKRKVLSENEAVLMIQSVYRGFEVRKSQPLMKLRQIAQVGKQVVDLRNSIQDLESSMDDKQKLIIGETIMSLLLKLDTIQGLHPIVRDVRKSVAKELVGLQEKLDSLTFVTSETLSEATESHEDDGGKVGNTALEPQVESQNEENTGELHNDQIPTLVEPEQPVDDSIDLEQAQSGNNAHEVEAADPIHDMKAEQLVEQISSELNNDHVQAQSGSNDEAVRLDLENHEVEVTDPVHDMKPEQLVEQITGDVNNDQIQMAVDDDDVIPENSDRAQSESGINVETMESGGREACDINLEPQVESEGKQSMVELTGDQLEMEEEIEPPVEEEKSDQREALVLKNVDSMEDVTTATVKVETDVSTVETAELGKEDVDLEEAPMVDDVDGVSKEVVLMEDFGGAPPVSATGSHVSSGGDRKIMEENERLRVVVEELMKAGNEQVSVIRELTGRVKDLEKKLSKKKRKVKRSNRRPRGSLVEEVCVV